MANQNENNEEVINHRELMEEEGLSIKDLPKEIQNQIKDFDNKLKKYEQTEDEDEESDIFLELQQDDVNIADNIQNWLEDNNSDGEDEEDYNPDEDDEEEEKKPVANNGNNKKPLPKQNQPIPNNNSISNTNTKTNNNAGNNIISPAKTVEQKIRENINNNVITVDKLTEIIGGEPDYPEHKIGSLRLRKQYLKPFYELIG